MKRTEAASSCEAHAGLLLCQSRQTSKCRYAERRMRRQCHSLTRKLDYWSEVLQRIEVHCIDVTVAADRIRPNEDGVTVRGAFRHIFHADIRIRAGLVFDHDLLAKCARKIIANDPGGHVRRPTSWKGNDKVDRAVRPVVSRGGERSECCEHQNQEDETRFHFGTALSRVTGIDYHIGTLPTRPTFQRPCTMLHDFAG
jgi:hypothetical protein